MHQAQWSPERPLPPPVSLASQSHHEKPPEVTCTSRGRQFSPKYEGSLTGQFNSKKKLPHLTTPRKMREQVGNPFPYRPRVWRWPLALPFQNPDLSRTQTSDHGRPDSMFAGCLSSETLPIVLLALPPLPPHFSSFHAPCLFGW